MKRFNTGIGDTEFCPSPECTQPSATAQPRLPRASANVGTGVPIGSRHQAIQAANDNLVRPVQLHGDLLNSLSEEQDSSSFADSRGPRKAYPGSPPPGVGRESPSTLWNFPVVAEGSAPWNLQGGMD